MKKANLLVLTIFIFAVLLIANASASCVELDEKECNQNKECTAIYDTDFPLFSHFMRCDYAEAEYYIQYEQQDKENKNIFSFITGAFAKFFDFITGKTGDEPQEGQQKKTIYIHSGSKLLAKVDVTNENV